MWLSGPALAFAAGLSMLNFLAFRPMILTIGVCVWGVVSIASFADRQRGLEVFRLHSISTSGRWSSCIGEHGCMYVEGEMNGLVVVCADARRSVHPKAINKHATCVSA